MVEFCTVHHACTKLWHTTTNVLALLVTDGASIRDSRLPGDKAMNPIV